MYVCWNSSSILLFVPQDDISSISSRLFIMVLPASLISELAEISKLLVSGMQMMH